MDRQIQTCKAPIARLFTDSFGNTYTQTLEDHLFAVAYHCKKAGEEIGIGLVCFLLGFFHDYGKASSNFQNYIQNNTKGKVNHSSQGGKVLYSYFSHVKNHEKAALIGEMLAYAIFAHHGLFDLLTPSQIEFPFDRRMNFNKEGKYQEEEYRSFLENTMIPRLQKETGHTLEDVLLKALGEMTGFLEKIDKLVEKLALKPGEEKGKAQWYYYHITVRLLLSILKEGDIYDSANAFAKEKEPLLSQKDYEDFWDKGIKNIEKKYEGFQQTSDGSPLNNLRENLALQAKEQAYGFSKGLLKAQLPTGERVIIVTGCRFYCSIKGFRNFKQLYFVHCLE